MAETTMRVDASRTGSLDGVALEIERVATALEAMEVPLGEGTQGAGEVLDVAARRLRREAATLRATVAACAAVVSGGPAPVSGGEQRLRELLREVLPYASAGHLDLEGQEEGERVLTAARAAVRLTTEEHLRRVLETFWDFQAGMPARAALHVEAAMAHLGMPFEGFSAAIGDRVRLADGSLAEVWTTIGDEPVEVRRVDPGDNAATGDPFTMRLRRNPEWRLDDLGNEPPEHVAPWVPLEVQG